MTTNIPNRVQIKEGWLQVQAILNGGTATIHGKVNTAPSYSLITVLEEGFTDVHVPAHGYYKVVLTGSAEVHT